ncbi:hypothetical protein [Pseudomonas sp. zfem002]|uniref:hypothetical protein n=1 Tax=Pseudomonas sp. zfem002 TaxID=3078197 RepID=UPI0029292937|nr:hypothetical protein [Pseudomonas sp. zfem002]MDU9394717.1 hypothetical protein [Pseudomonas sp. zfem002]
MEHLRIFCRKEAMICVLHSIQIRREWQKVLSCVSRDGSVVRKDENVSSIVEKEEQDLVEFLQLGFDRDADLQREKERVFEVFDCLKEDVSFGYALAMNNTIYYKLNAGDNPNYSRCLSAGACGEVLV